MRSVAVVIEGVVLVFKYGCARLYGLLTRCEEAKHSLQYIFFNVENTCAH